MRTNCSTYSSTTRLRAASAESPSWIAASSLRAKAGSSSIKRCASVIPPSNSGSRVESRSFKSASSTTDSLSARFKRRFSSFAWPARVASARPHDPHAERRAALDDRHAEEGVVFLLAGIREELVAGMGDRIDRHHRLELLDRHAGEPLLDAHRHLADRVPIETDGRPQREA